MSSQEIKPYDRQPTDTDKSWAAFCMYRDMGRERGLEKLLKKYPESTPKSYLRVLKLWSAKHKWVKRCRVFDEEELERESITLRDLRLKRRLEMEKKAWDKHKNYEAKAKQVLSIPVAKSVTSEDGKTIYNPTDKWSLKDAIALDEYAHRLAIFATGGETPKMTEIDAVRVLAQAGLLPAEILEAAERGSDALRSLLTEAFQNLKKPISDS